MQGKRYLGKDKREKLLRKKFSKVKRNLVQRIYNTNNPSYKYYGGDGVTMDTRWKNDLNIFIDEATKLPGYDEKLFLEGKLALDKDYLGDSKFYNKECCSWVSLEDNNKNKPHQQKKFMVTNSITGEILGVFINQSEVSRIIGTYPSSISNALIKTGHYKEYLFKYIK